MERDLFIFQAFAENNNNKIKDFSIPFLRGECEVQVSVKEETDLVICNGSNLEVQAASVWVGEEEISGQVSSSEEEEKLTLKLGIELEFI